MTCGCGCGGKNGCCSKKVLRKGYAFKLRYKAINKTTNLPIDFTGRRVVVQFRNRRTDTAALLTISSDTVRVIRGDGFIEINLPMLEVNAITWSAAIAEIAVEWTPGNPEWQFSFPVGVEQGLVAA